MFPRQLTKVTHRRDPRWRGIDDAEDHALGEGESMNRCRNEGPTRNPLSRGSSGSGQSHVECETAGFSKKLLGGNQSAGFRFWTPLWIDRPISDPAATIFHP